VVLLLESTSHTATLTSSYNSIPNAQEDGSPYDWSIRRFRDVGHAQDITVFLVPWDIWDVRDVPDVLDVPDIRGGVGGGGGGAPPPPFGVFAGGGVCEIQEDCAAWGMSDTSEIANAPVTW